MARELEDMSGFEKAAVVLMAMDSKISGAVLKHLNEAEIEKVTHSIATLGDISPKARETTMEDFHGLMTARGYIAEGGMDLAQKMLADALGEDRAAEITGRVESVLSRGFNLLKDVSPDVLANFIRNEHPQTLGLILAQLDAGQSAAVLAELPEDLQVEVAMRIAKIKTVSPEMMRDVEDVLESQLAAMSSGEGKTTDGPKVVAEILNFVERASQRNILSGLEAEHAEIAAQVRDLMLVFEDIILLDDRSIRLVMQNVETKELAKALKSASDEVKQRIFGNVSERVQTVLQEEIEYLGPTRLSDIEAAQQIIVEQMQRLEDEGQIVVSRGEGKEEIII